MNRLVHCIYSSRATPGFAEAQLPEILEASRKSNAAQDISGMLLYVEGNFFQVLEGAAEHVDTLFERICRDERHTRVTRIIHEPIAERDFADWSMGYARLDAREVAQHAGINDFFSAATCMARLGPGRARKLLQAFSRGRWRAGDTGLHTSLSRMA